MIFQLLLKISPCFQNYNTEFVSELMLSTTFYREKYKEPITRKNFSFVDKIISKFLLASVAFFLPFFFSSGYNFYRYPTIFMKKLSHLDIKSSIPQSFIKLVRDEELLRVYLIERSGVWCCLVVFIDLFFIFPQAAVPYTMSEISGDILFNWELFSNITRFGGDANLLANLNNVFREFVYIFIGNFWFVHAKQKNM